MPMNSSERRLAELSQRTFLKLWSYPNPFRTAGREIADLIVVFGRDVVVFSDKAITFRFDNETVAWKRWFRRAVVKSVKQLAGASQILDNETVPIFVDDRANRALPFALPPVKDRRVHLVAVARTEFEASEQAKAWPGLTFDNTVTGPERPFCIGPLKTKDRFVHLFEARTLEIILEEFDTIGDFVAYLVRRECAIQGSTNLKFQELDLVMLALLERSGGAWGLLLEPELSNSQGTIVPPELWDDTYMTECRKRSRLLNRKSYVIDQLIEHFHAEYNFHQISFPFTSHEQALRKLASETRFGRRIIAAALFEILDEAETNSFWASTTPSQNIAGVRYVWLTYPTPPPEENLDTYHQFILDHLKDHIYAARSVFPSELIIGVALPNRSAEKALEIKSRFLVVFDGTKWTDEAQRGAEALRHEYGIFDNLEELTYRHVP